MRVRVGLFVVMLLAIGVSLAQAQSTPGDLTPGVTCDDDGLLPPGFPPCSKQPDTTPTVEPLPTCQLPFPRRFGEWSDTDGRFHIGNDPIVMSCGNEEVRDWNFAALRAWTTFRWQQRQFLNRKTGDLDSEAFSYWQSVINQVQARDRLDPGGERIKAEIQSVCRCRL